MRRTAVIVLSTCTLLVAAPVAGGRVLRVGTYHGIRGQFRSIQVAIDKAKQGDWVLVGPGDYKTTTSGRSVTGTNGSTFPAGVLIQTPHLKLRGMNRNAVIVDGTRSGPPCSSAKADQNFGLTGSNGPTGLNGIMVWKANSVWVQNLTACNFLNGSEPAGNEIWWNGGADSGGATTVSIGGWGFLGSYLNATSTWFDTSGSISQAEASAAAYGIFSSNWSGGVWDHTYASNMNDSNYYIGACSQVCNQTVNHAWSEFSALGYSGSNSGGQMVIENSQFDNNELGFSTNTQNGDNPPPQDGTCPGNGTSPITHTHSCWVFMRNYVHDNNDPNVPTAGSAAAGPVGTGMSISGGRNDTVMDNTFANNKAWGIIFVPYPDSGPPCTGGTGGSGPNAPCDYEEWGNALLNNKFSNNGGYGNPTNGDFGWSSLQPDPTNCASGNRDSSGVLTTAPSNFEQSYPTCDGHTVPPAITDPQGAQFTAEVLCDSQISLTAGAQPPCAPGDSYPRETQINAGLHPLPPRSQLQTMPNPCAGVPHNPWCPGKKHKRKHRRP